MERSWTRRLGPGLITGAADDDPSGIGTYSQAGAQFGYNLLWTLLLTYPLMTAIQLVSARIGRVTGKGLASNMRVHYSKWLAYAVTVLLMVANVINIAADLSAMGAAFGLLVHGPQQVFIVCSAACRPSFRYSFHTTGMRDFSNGQPLCFLRMSSLHSSCRCSGGTWCRRSYCPVCR